MGRIGPGARVSDRYLVISELGRGGMGVVYLARDERADRDVAIKVLHEAPQSEAARRLQREARAMGSLDPKGVASVYEVGETDGELYLVMEHVRGATLRSLLRKGRLPRAEALRILRAAATTLGQAHRAGLVHRDVKPDNFMIAEDGRVVLLDFGIVKRLTASEDTAHLSTQLTTEGSVIGTPAYLSPEQALGRSIGPETDQFALAVVAFEMLTGKLPWSATEVTTMLAQVLAETPPPASGVETDLHPAFDSVLGRALSKAPARRFGSVEDFVDALHAAERGEYIPLEVSETVAATPAALTGGGVSSGRLPAPKSRWAGALLGLVVVGAAAGLFARSRMVRSKPGPSAVETAVAALSGPDARLACPIFDVRGVVDASVRLGAASATIACMRARWYLGGLDERVLVPASLLDLPREPMADFSDPYLAPEERARTLDLARKRAPAYIDGTVTREADAWLAELSVNAPDGQAITKASGRDPSYEGAMKKSLDALWSRPLLRRPIDPAVSRWTSVPDTDVGIFDSDVFFLGDREGCASFLQRGAALGNAIFGLNVLCGSAAESVDAGVPVLDESSPSALLASEAAFVATETPQSPEERRRIVTKLEGFLSAETSSYGKAWLAYIAGVLWRFVNEQERSHAALLVAARENPLLSSTWHQLLAAAAGTGSTAQTLAVASAWFPTEAAFLAKAKSHRADELEARLRDARLAFLLEPGLQQAMLLGRALAEAGRTDEARVVAATDLGDAEQNRLLKSYVLALVDLHDARLGHAIADLEEAGNIGMLDLVSVAGVAGTSEDVSTRWATKFLARPDADVDITVRGYTSPIVLCMKVRGGIAQRCLERVERLGHASLNWWGEGGDELLEGAKHYARGDVKGAVAIWRPLVAGPTELIARVLPTEAFERAGQPELAARLDERKMAYAFIAGVSEAAPREAKRAMARGDRDKARQLAEKVVKAWEVADVEVPAVSEMRALLRAGG